jgi:hypothetical protein
MRSIQFIGLIAALPLFLISCDNELPDKKISGEEVSVHIRSLGITEGGSKSIRNSSLQKEPKTVLTPVGDGMVLEMSIKEDKSPLRGTVELADGVCFRVIAVEAGTTEYYSHGDFKYGDPITLHSDFHVRIGKTYDFICFTFNTTNIADLPNTNNYTVGNDLPTSLSHSGKDVFWWHSTSSMTIPEEGVELDITLTPKKAKAKLILDLSYNDWNITSIANNKIFTAGMTAPQINWSTGVLSSGYMYGAYFTWPTPTSPYSTQLTSNEVAFVPPSEDTYVQVQFEAGAISREGNLPTLPSGTIFTRFHDQLFETGVSYTILIRLRVPIFARSNVYWDDSEKKMTFEAAADDPADNDDSKLGYQGLFFKFGSLVGISPSGTSYSTSSTLLYKAGDPTPYKGTAWGSIPYWDAMVDVTGEPDIANSKGDICKYINSDYRLPYWQEFGMAENWDTFGWEKVNSFGDVTANDAEGKYDFMANGDALALNTTMFDIMFPISGYRDKSNGSKGTTEGNKGHYGTSYSSYSNTTCGFGRFNDEGLYFWRGASYRNDAISIRCVKN